MAARKNHHSIITTFRAHGLAVMLGAVLLSAGPADARVQDDAPMPASIVPHRIRLLPEGSSLVNVRGTITRHRLLPNWVLTIDDPRSVARDVELMMLPNRRLEDMELVLSTAKDGEVITFEVTGEVFAYGSRNYLLASTAPRLVTRSATPPPATAPSEASSTEPASEMSDDSIESIMRQLDDAAGPIPRATASAREDERADDAGSTETGDGATAITEDGALVINRRGHVHRDASGGWRFVFDADAHGQDDPAVMLMPCLMLERIERYSNSLGRNTPLLISGHVYRYRGQRYMLPTMMQRPRERTRLGGVNDQH
ncbi:MAG: hypothetical protein KC983_00935 [Phycisphaerales bacterium]|nr:hypothetical protein [Phycisphaerales bacterium]